MARHAAPASKTPPTTWWAYISEDNPPQIWGVSPYREHLERQDLRHIRVRIVPVIRKHKPKSSRR